MDNKKWVQFPQTSPSEHSSTLREPLTDFLHQHLTDVKNKGTLSDQMSPSLSTEPNCSVRRRFLTNSPPALPKAETILKSNPYFHQNQCSDSFRFPLYGHGCDILVATSEISKAASKGIYHKNTASRKISRLTKQLNKIKA